MEIVVPANLLQEHAAQLLRAVTRTTHLLPVGGTPGDPGIACAEGAISGSYGSVSFRELLGQMPRLRWVHSLGAGMDDFVSAELVGRGIIVTNAGDAYAPAMTEYVVAALVALARDLPVWFQQGTKRDWEREIEGGKTLAGKRVGIVGYGAVGRGVAAACKGLGMETWATRRTPIAIGEEPLDRLLRADEVGTLVEASDAIVLSASLNSTTAGMVNSQLLGRMRVGAYLVNVARGGLIDQDALVSALASGRIGGAVLDVTEPEPLPKGHPLRVAPNTFITPHISGDTAEGRNRSLSDLCLNLRCFALGRLDEMVNRVDITRHL